MYTNVFVYISSFFFLAEISREEIQKRRELRFSLCTANNFSFNSFDQIGEVIQDEWPKSIQLHQTKNKALAESVLGPYFREELLADLRHEDSFFSILTDETTDISVNKLLTFSVRYYSPKYRKIKETHLDLKELTRATGEILFNTTGNIDIFVIQ